jgi:hypothetical protein
MNQLIIGLLAGALLCGTTLYFVFPKHATEIAKEIRANATQAAKPKYEWPDTEPIDKSDPYWELNNNLNANGTQYKKEEVSPGKWQWVVDQKIMQWKAEQAARRHALFWALRSRVLTDDEMKEVTQYGTQINIDEMVPYYEADKARELNDALLQQAKLRATAASAQLH